MAYTFLENSKENRQQQVTKRLAITKSRKIEERDKGGNSGCTRPSLKKKKTHTKPELRRQRDIANAPYAKKKMEKKKYGKDCTLYHQTYFKNSEG